MARYMVVFDTSKGKSEVYKDGAWVNPASVEARLSEGEVTRLTVDGQDLLGVNATSAAAKEMGVDTQKAVADIADFFARVEDSE